MFKALGDPVRLRLLSLIASQGADGRGVRVRPDRARSTSPQPTISHHLKVLREAGLVDCERRGTWVYYWVVPAALDRLSSLLQSTGDGTATAAGDRRDLPGATTARARRRGWRAGRREASARRPGRGRGRLRHPGHPAAPMTSALQLLANSLATVLGLGVLIPLLGPVSGAHFNPVVTLAAWWTGRRGRPGLTAAGARRLRRRPGRRARSPAPSWPTRCSALPPVQLVHARPLRRVTCGWARWSPPPA